MNWCGVCEKEVIMRVIVKKGTAYMQCSGCQSKMPVKKIDDKGVLLYSLVVLVAGVMTVCAYGIR